MIDFPNSPSIGQVFNSGTGAIYIWDGVAWSLATSSTRTARQNNLVVNPSMIVSQENGAAAGSTNGYYPVDQWQSAIAGPVCSFQQVASLTPENSLNRIRKTVTTPKASLAAGDLSCIIQNIEGIRVSSLGYGTAAACQAVLRFGFKGPAGTYSAVVRNGAAPFRAYIKNFTIAAGQANTDTVQTFVVPGDTTGTWPTDNTIGMSLFVVDAVGTGVQGVEGWQAGNLLGTAANSNMVATNGNVVELFDVGLYPDPEKTGLPPPFIAPKYSDALYDCQRYWERLAWGGVAAYHAAGGMIGCSVDFKTSKRVTPTGAITGWGGSANVNSQAMNNMSTEGFFFTLSVVSAGGGFMSQVTGTANARI